MDTLVDVHHFYRIHCPWAVSVQWLILLHLPADYFIGSAHVHKKSWLDYVSRSGNRRFPLYTYWCVVTPFLDLDARLLQQTGLYHTYNATTWSFSFYPRLFDASVPVLLFDAHLTWKDPSSSLWHWGEDSGLYVGMSCCMRKWGVKCICLLHYPCCCTTCRSVTHTSDHVTFSLCVDT